MSRERAREKEESKTTTESNGKREYGLQRVLSLVVLSLVVSLVVFFSLKSHLATKLTS